MTYRLIRHRESYIALIYSSAQDLGDGRQPSRLDASPLSTLPIGTDTVISTGTHLRVTRIRAYRASAHTQGPINWEPQGVAPHDRAGPPGAIYSSNRGLLEHPPTVPREKRDWKAEKRKRKNTGADGQQASGP